MRVFAALLPLVCVSATNPPQPVLFGYPQVHQVSCLEGTGTAFRISDNEYLSVAHVASLHECAIDSEPLEAVEINGDLDFAILRTHRHGRGFPIDCSGFHRGEYVFAVGYAHGWAIQHTMMLVALGQNHISGKAALIGPEAVIPGMSGGPVLNAAGEVVGTVNAYSKEGYSFSRALKDTSLCLS